MKNLILVMLVCSLHYLSFGQTPCNGTTTPTLIKASTAVSGGNVCSSCTIKGICWSTSPSPVATLPTKTTNGSGTGSFTISMTGLKPATRYYVRLYYGNPVVNPFTGQSSIVYGYGNECTFVTATADLPVLTTTAISGATDIAAVSGGNITSSIGAAVTQKGVCWSTSPNPTTSLATKTSQGGGIGAFTSNVSGLLPSTTYYIRAYATNSAGTAYGNQITFSTGVTYQGQLYAPVTIGTKTWLKPDLRAEKYANGDFIPSYNPSMSWATITTGAYSLTAGNCITISGQPNTCDKLYNYYAVIDPRGLCPTGWHVATAADFTSIENALGNAGAGGKLKSTATITVSSSGFSTGSGWDAPNTGATNSTGFTAVPTGQFETTLVHTGTTQMATWWLGGSSSTSLSSAKRVSHNSADISMLPVSRNTGLAVRCVKN